MKSQWKLSQQHDQNEIVSKPILSWDFKMEFCLNRGLVWKSLEINNFNSLFVKLQFVELQYNSEPRQDGNSISRSQK